VEKKKPDFNKLITLVLYIVVVIVLNLVLNNLFVRVDLTKNSIYTLSEASKKAVETLKEPLTVKAFFSKNLPNPYNTIEQQVRDLFEEFSVLSPEYFNYEFYEMSTEEDSSNEQVIKNQGIAQDYSIYPIQIQNFENDEISLQNVYMGVAFIHGDMIETISQLNTTYQLEYNITSTIQKMNNKISVLLGLEDKVQVKMYYSSMLGNTLNQYANEIDTVIKELNKQHNGVMEFSAFDTKNNPDLEAEAESYNTYYIPIPNEEGEEEGKAYIGLILTYKDQFKQVPLITYDILGRTTLLQVESIKEYIKITLEDIIGINEEIGYVTSNGTLQLYELSAFNNQLSDNYTVKQIDLKEADIADFPETLIIASPKQPFTEYELLKIDQHLMRGNSLAIFYEPYNIIDVSQTEMAAYAQQQPFLYIPLDNLGLDKLLEHYGLTVEQAYVLDTSCYTQTQDEYGRPINQDVYYLPLIPKDCINSEISITKQLNEFLLLHISPLIYNPEAQPDVRANLLFTSTETSWKMTENINVHSPVMIFPPSKEEMKKQDLAYLLEGNFTSYFKGKEIPKPEVQETEETATEVTTGISDDLIGEEISIIEQSNGGKIFLIGSSKLLTDGLFVANQKISNSVFVLNTIDYLNNREEQAVLRSKVQTLPSLNEDITPEVKSFTKAFNIIVVPGFVIVFGIVIFILRTRRKKRIQLTFSKESKK
jgi:ABC-2 type transport system permease protein